MTDYQGIAINMPRTEAEGRLRKNAMEENLILTILGKPTVSWGDVPPIIPPDEATIQAVLAKIHAPPPNDDAIVNLSDYDFSCMILNDVGALPNSTQKDSPSVVAHGEHATFVCDDATVARILAAVEASYTGPQDKAIRLDPGEVIVQGETAQFVCDAALEPVGVDWGGTVMPISDISYDAHGYYAGDNQGLARDLVEGTDYTMYSMPKTTATT